MILKRKYVKELPFQIHGKARLLRGNIASVPAWITWSNVDKVPYFRSVFPGPVSLRCHSFPSSPRRPFNFSLPSQWLHCQSVSFVKTINHTKKKREKKKALWGELWLSAGCLSYLKSVSFIFCIAFSLWLDSDDWQSLTDMMFFSLFLHKTYFCIFTLKNLLLSVMQFCYSWVYIYTDIHIFLYPPPFFPLISSVLMFRNPHLRSIIDYIMWTAISFLHLCMNWDFCKNAFTVLVCKIYV